MNMTMETKKKNILSKMLNSKKKKMEMWTFIVLVRKNGKIFNIDL